VIDDVEYVYVLTQLATAYHYYPPHLILNLDESNWYFTMAGDEVVAERGAEGDESVQNSVDEIQKPFFHSSP
jgi:hypothetical protein